MQNIHATAVSIKSQGILLLGSSGSGKSDLALRLIVNHGAKLISDDRTDISKQNHKIYISAPKNIKGLLEVRGIGIINVKSKGKTRLKAVFELTDQNLERMPQPLQYSLLDENIPLFKINPFEPSSTAKILAALSLL